MRITLEGSALPGRSWEGHENVHVALQVGREPQDPVPGDAPRARWETDVQVVDGDFRGPAVQGKRGERFLYLTWGDQGPAGFAMFRRLKVMLADLGPAAAHASHAHGALGLTDLKGGPLCGRARPGTIRWTLS